MADSILRNTISHLAAGVYRFKREKERNYSLNTAFAHSFDKYTTGCIHA